MYDEKSLAAQEFTKKCFYGLRGRCREFVTKLRGPYQKTSESINPKGFSASRSYANVNKECNSQTSEQCGATEDRDCEKKNKTSFKNNNERVSDSCNFSAASDGGEESDGERLLAKENVSVNIDNRNDVTSSYKRPLQNITNHSLWSSLNAKDKFKKFKKRRTIYLNVPKMTLLPSAHLVGLPTGGICKVYWLGENRTLNSASTCCVDCLLMVMSAAFRECSFIRNSINDLIVNLTNEDSISFLTCIKELVAASTASQAVTSRAKLLLSAPMFLKPSVVECPLEATDALSKSLRIYVNGNECNIAEYCLLPLCQLFRTSICQRVGCDDRTNVLKFILIEERSIEECVISLTSEVTESGKCGSRVRVVKDDGNSDEEGEDDSFLQSHYDPLTEVSGWKTRASGCVVSNVVCSGKRTSLPIQHLSSSPPSLLVFVVPEAMVNDARPSFRVNCQDTMTVFGVKYSHRATSYLQRPHNLHGSGHYVSVIRMGGLWYLYDGLRHYRKCQTWTGVSGPCNSYVRFLDISLIVYTRDDV